MTPIFHTDCQALKLYTDSVRFAPYTGEGKGEELGLALANRSAVLAQVKEFRLVESWQS